MKTNFLNGYVQPEAISSLSNLELVARMVVEGYMTGLHKSPFHGFSVEFSQHRPYMTGDSLRFVDWKVYGRTDRYYIKQFEEETNLRCNILLDISRSMAYGSGKVRKSDYASYLAASLAYLMIRQRDATGLVLFDNEVRKILPPKSANSYLNQIYSAIRNANYSNDTSISTALHQVAEQMKRRGLIIIISDLLDNPDDLLAGLRHFRHDQHEVLVFQILDEQEINFDFSGDIIFEDLETEEKIKTQARYIQNTYRKNVDDFLKYYKTNFSNYRIDYQQFSTNNPFSAALTEYLIKRKKLH